MSDQIQGKRVLITGATDGLGKATAFALAKMGANVIVHGRNINKARTTREELEHLTKNKQIGCVAADFESLAEIKSLAGEIIATYPDLKILINNAGIFEPNLRFTADNNEATFQVNFLAPFVLTNLLLSLAVSNMPFRIINVSSTLHNGAVLDFDNLNGDSYYDGHEAYAASKLALVLFTKELAERLQGTSITVNSLHPGIINTKLLDLSFGGGGVSPLKGAKTTVLLASTEELGSVSGKYFAYEKEANCDRRIFNVELRKRVWVLGERLTGIQGLKRAA